MESLPKITAVLITKENEYPNDVDIDFPFDEVIIETNCPHIYRRYELMAQARNEIIYVQDDDCVIDVHRLWKEYNGKLTHAIKEHHQKFYEGTGMTLIGWGAFFPKSMVDFSKYLDKHPKDELFLLTADRIFTYLNQPHNSILMPIHDLPRASDSTRMSTRKDRYHYDELEYIKNRLKKL